MSELETMLPVLDDRPSEWRAIPEALLEMLAPASGILTPDQRVAINQIAVGQHFLLRNELGARCGHCRQGRLPGAIHPYVTIRCVEAPFNGLREAYTWLDASEHGEAIKNVIRLGTLVPISADMAARLEARIVQRGGRTIMQQQPVQRAEMQASVFTKRMRTRAARAAAENARELAEWERELAMYGRIVSR